MLRLSSATPGYRERMARLNPLPAPGAVPITSGPNGPGIDHEKEPRQRSVQRSRRCRSVPIGLARMYVPRSGFLLLLSLAAAVVLQAVPASAQTDARPRLVALVLKGEQVGTGYRLLQRPDGHGVAGLVTLDMCGFTFRSEQLRTARLQVNYVRPGSPVKLSNEVVTYRPGGAAEAMREVAAAARSCPTTPVASTVQGVGPVSYRVRRTTAHELLPGAVVLRIHVSGTVRGKHVSEANLAVYQRSGDILSALYAFGGTQEARERIALHAAAESASNLQRR
jgi:hypothetical protein